MRPRVSIVIPVYNGSNYLREAIDSALAQTYEATEVIVVDDGSTDGGATEAIGRSYGDRIRYVAKPNGGVSSALNRGLREMRGDWFCWLSHDDRYLPEKTSAQIAYAEAHPEAKWIACNFELIDAGGRVTGTIREPHPILRTGREILDTWVFGCSLMIHRSCFDAAGPFNEANRTTQDLEMWLRIVEHFPLHSMPDVLCQLRQHEEAGSRVEERHTRDKDELFGWMLGRYDAAFFDPQRSAAPEERAEVYFWLSHNALNRGARAGSRLCLKRAWREWPSLRNPALFRLVFGIRTWLLLNHIRAQAGSKWRWLKRRLAR